MRWVGIVSPWAVSCRRSVYIILASGDSTVGGGGESSIDDAGEIHRMHVSMQLSWHLRSRRSPTTFLADTPIEDTTSPSTHYISAMSLEQSFRRLAIRSKPICQQCRRSFATSPATRQQSNATAAVAGMNISSPQLRTVRLTGSRPLLKQRVATHKHGDCLPPHPHCHRQHTLL